MFCTIYVEPINMIIIMIIIIMPVAGNDVTYNDTTIERY